MVFPAVNSQILTIGVFIGIVVSMIFYERELLSPGGVVVPGYTALFLIANPLFGLLAGPFPYLFTGPYSYQGFQVIGIIIPGLIANELHRQGIVPTLATLGTVSVITAIILYVIIMLV